jgi:glycosyltransferase involved in cell wall biosynthesis
MHIGLFDPDWRGHHTPYVDLLSRYFTNEGHRVTFVTDERHERLDELPDAEGLSVVTRPFPGDPPAPSSFFRSVQDQYFRARQLRTALRIASQRRFDVLHLLYFDRLQIPLRLVTLPDASEVPVVATQHRDAFVSGEGDSSGRGLRSGIRVPDITTLALDSSFRQGVLDVLTVHADDIRDRIIDAVPSATRETVKTIPAPTPEPDVTSDTPGLRAELDLPAGRDVLLFFGGLRHEKGPDILADQLRELDRPVTVVFAGSLGDFSQGDVDQWKRDAASSVEVVDRLEYIPEEEVDKYFAAVDATILPYRRARGISGPLRRSANVGTPAVGTVETDIGRLIERHELGATFNPDDRATFTEALDRVLDVESERRAALNAFASSRHWENTGEALVDIYEDILRK